MDNLEIRLQRWRAAHLIDAVTADRIREFEEANRQKRRWPMILAVGFGTLMLCAGVLLFVAAHWDELSPASRFILVLAMVAVFQELWAEVTVPRKGPPRPIQLAIKNGTDWRPLNLR